MSTNETLQSLIRSTGLSESSARSLLARCNGDLQAALEEAHRSNWVQAVLSHISLNLGNLVSGVFMFLRGLFLPQRRISAFATEFRNSLVDDRGTPPDRIVTFTEGSITQVVTQAISAAIPCCVIAVDSLTIHRHSEVQRLWARVMADQDVMEAINTTCMNHGFDINAALSNKLVARMLQWEATSVAAISLLLPLRLSPALAQRYKRLLQSESRVDSTPGVESVWTTAEQEALFEAIQTKFVSTEPPTIGQFSLDIVRGGVVQCYKFNLTPTDTLPSVDAVKQSIIQATRAAQQLAQPVVEKRDQTRLRAQRDRELRAAQDWEYENSLRADQERLKREREERELEAARCREQEEIHRRHEEEQHRKERIAREIAEQMLRAESVLEDCQDSDFASILLRVAPANERLRLRVHKDITIERLQNVVEKLDHMLKTSDGCVWVRPSQDSVAAACQVETGTLTRTKKMPTKFMLMPALGGQPFDKTLSIEQCGLLPNAVVHVHPLVE